MREREEGSDLTLAIQAWGHRLVVEGLKVAHFFFNQDLLLHGLHTMKCYAFAAIRRWMLLYLIDVSPNRIGADGSSVGSDQRSG